MAWTLPTALFFTCIAAALLLLTVLELKVPTRARRGLLPLVTTRGDRFFMALLLAAFVHVVWLKFSDASLLWASLLAFGAASALMRWG